MHDLADIPIDELEAHIATLCAEISQSMQRWLALVAEFDRRGGARRWGFRGSAEWLAWHCGLSERTAREQVRVARGLTTRPLVCAAFAAGNLSYSKVRALTRAPDGEDEAALLEYAHRQSAGELERLVAGMRRQPSAGVDVARAAHARRYVDWTWEPDGSLSIRARLAPEDGAAFIEAVETAAESLHPLPDRVGFDAVTPAESGGVDAPRLPPPGDADTQLAPPPRDADTPLAAPRVEGGGSPAVLPDASAPAPSRPPLGARRADALAEITRSGAPRALVVLHVDEPALACTATESEDRAGETCVLEHGPAIPSETARRLSCDSELTIARHDADRPATDYGRRRRTVPPPLRAALERRDRGCRFPGCERRHDLHAHHVRHWAHGGATTRDNLVLLCRFHHRLVHEDGFTVEPSAAEKFTFRRPDGRPIAPDGPRPAAARDDRGHVRAPDRHGGAAVDPEVVPARVAA